MPVDAHIVILALLVVIIGLLVWPYVERRFFQPSPTGGEESDADAPQDQKNTSLGDGSSAEMD